MDTIDHTLDWTGKRVQLQCVQPRPRGKSVELKRRCMVEHVLPAGAAVPHDLIAAGFYKPLSRVSKYPRWLVCSVENNAGKTFFKARYEVLTMDPLWQGREIFVQSELPL